MFRIPQTLRRIYFLYRHHVKNMYNTIKRFNSINFFKIPRGCFPMKEIGATLKSTSHKNDNET